MMKDARTQLYELANQNRKAHEKYSHLSASDSFVDLNHPRAKSWCRILSSVATTESIEQVLMAPLENAFQENPDILDYISSHKQDEMRHHELLNRYLKNTFNYVKKKRTLSDQVIYDHALPQIAKTFEFRPIYGLAMLLFFETYGVTFYRSFKAQASKARLHGLVQIIHQIEKDELRHMRGLALLWDQCGLVKQKNSRLNRWLDRNIIAGFLKLLVFDVNMNPWALHNRAVRVHAMRVGLDPHFLTENAYSAARKVLTKITQENLS